jgi:phage tail-like protein
VTVADPTLLRTFRFRVQLRKAPQAISGAPAPAGAPAGDPLGDGAFQDCSGLEVEMDVQEYLEGGRNDGVIRRVGRGKYTNIVLKRGMFYGDGEVNRDLWVWIQSIVSGTRPVPRYNGIIEVMGSTDDVVATWTFDRGLPAKIKGPELNAKTGEIAIEELTIAHEGLRLEAP